MLKHLANVLAGYNKLGNNRNIAETSFKLGLFSNDMGNESGKTDYLQKFLGYYSEIYVSDIKPDSFDFFIIGYCNEMLET